MNQIKLPAYGIVVIINEGGGKITSDLLRGVRKTSRLFAAIDGMESLILSHACAGIDIETPAYLEGIETTVEAIFNHYA